MSSIASVVAGRLRNEPFLVQALSRRIVNFGALAVEFQPGIEKALGRPVKVSAIAMALHRFGEKQRPQKTAGASVLRTELVLRTGLVDLTLARSGSLIHKVRELYAREDLSHGDFFNIIWGTQEVGVITDEKHLAQAQRVFEGERVLNVEPGLVALSMTFGKDFFYSPGAIARVTNELAWHHVNIFEVVSTLTEFTVLVKKKDATRAFEILDALFSPNGP